MGFTKLDSGIVDSSIWSEPVTTRVVWIAILAKSDQNGFLACSYPGLLRAANVSQKDFDIAIKTLESPDKHSRTPDNEGRRIEKVDGGWIILNFEKYRTHSEMVKEQTRDRVRKFREKKKSVTHCNVTGALPSVSVSVSDSASDSESDSCIDSSSLVLSSSVSDIGLILSAGPGEWLNDDYQAGKEWAIVLNDRPGISVEVVRESAAAYKTYCQETGKRGKYVISAGNWIRGGRWNDKWEAKLKSENKGEGRITAKDILEALGG